MKRLFLGLLAVTTTLACAEASPTDVDSAPLQAESCGSDSCGGIWKPRSGLDWDWQLVTPVDARADVDIYDIDVFTSSAELIARLHAQGRKVVCYVNVGAWEAWRPDADTFPPALLGKTWSRTRFQDERWLDIRRIDLLGPLLGARFDMAKQKGCDAIEPDNIDGYDGARAGQDRTGFRLTYDDQLRFNRYIAAEAHRRGLAIALKNDPAQAKELEPDFDFVVSEQCFDYDECGAYKPFADANKAILLAEYSEDLGLLAESRFERMCPQARALGISAILKRNNLDSWRRACPALGASPAAAPDGGVRPPARPPTPPPRFPRPPTGPIRPITPRGRPVDAGVSPPRFPRGGRFIDAGAPRSGTIDAGLVPATPGGAADAGVP